MHLIWFHRVLIGAAVVFFTGFGIWELVAYRRDGAIAPLFFGLASLAAAILLLLYLSRLRRILKLPH